MDSQQPKAYETGPKGYAQLSEEEDSYSPSVPEGQNRGHTVNNPYGPPVVAQGIPVMSYPAPMSNFEISHPNSSQPHKLDSCGFSCYKIWLVINIISVVLKVIGGIVGGRPEEGEYEPIIPGLKFFDFAIDGWSAVIFIIAFSAIREKSLEKIDRALIHMKYFLIVKGVYTVVAMIDAYEFISERLSEQFPEMQLTCKTGSCQAQHYIAGIISLIIGVAITLGVWFVLFMLPAINAQKLLRRAAPARNPVENC